jgi:protein-S-isoprenylcysteine O-methyltransferase Ste14
MAPSFAQGSLAAAILLANIGAYMVVTPPNPNTTPILPTGDWLRQWGFTDDNKITTSLRAFPPAFISLHTALLAWHFRPDPNPKSNNHIPRRLLRHGPTNAFNKNLITWSRATAIPLFFLLAIGIPLRLTAYSTLGKNFTFGLAEPDRLITTGIYRFVQHPSYTALIITVIAQAALMYRTDGALSCWISPRWYGLCRRLEVLMVPVWAAVILLVVMKRVPQEEAMMRATFGKEWESWHSETPRFVPWVF